jgi:polyisoprenoid-binding protein YceI
LEGELRLKSVSSTIKIPIEVSGQAEYLSIKADFKVNRRDFGVGDKSWLMADEVQVKVVYKGKK